MAGGDGGGVFGMGEVGVGEGGVVVICGHGLTGGVGDGLVGGVLAVE